MTNYLCMQRSEPGQKNKEEKPSPAQMQEMFAKFNAWKDKFEKNIVDMGGRLSPGKLVTAQGETNGTLVETKELIGGYMILSAESLEEAIEVAQACPGLVSPGSSVWVREINTH